MWGGGGGLLMRKWWVGGECQRPSPGDTYPLSPLSKPKVCGHLPGRECRVTHAAQPSPSTYSIY